MAGSQLTVVLAAVMMGWWLTLVAPETPGVGCGMGLERLLLV